MGYDYEYGNDNAKPAGKIADGQGACPPEVVEYRIYPEVDFNFYFGNPPATVIT